MIGVILYFNQDAFALFSIEIPETPYIDFGFADPGEILGDIPPDGLDIICTSDLGNPWFLNIRLDTPLTNVNNPESTIDSENFFAYGISTTGQGVLVTERQDLRLDIPRTLYSAPAGEGLEGININIRFRLDIPRLIQSGRYTTQIIFTLTE